MTRVKGRARLSSPCREGWETIIGGHVLAGVCTGSLARGEELEVGV